MTFEESEWNDLQCALPVGQDVGKEYILEQMKRARAMEFILLRLHNSRSMLRPLRCIQSISSCMSCYRLKHKQLTSMPCLGTLSPSEEKERANILSIAGL